MSGNQTQFFQMTGKYATACATSMSSLPDHFIFALLSLSSMPFRSILFSVVSSRRFILDVPDLVSAVGHYRFNCCCINSWFFVLSKVLIHPDCVLKRVRCFLRLLSRYVRVVLPQLLHGLFRRYFRWYA